jgi:TM2 domain-containing membrane protein YozV
VARSQIRRTGQQGDGLALAGIIVGFVGLIFAIIWAIFVATTASHINNNPYGLAPLLLR